MTIGVLKERKREYRVALTPAGTKALSEARHRVLVEKGAGEGNSFVDDEFQKGGNNYIIKDKRRVVMMSSEANRLDQRHTPIHCGNSEQRMGESSI